jgi:hypothetical protein
VRRNRSGASVVQSPIDIKRWQQSAPTVAEARPCRCPACGAPSCPVGGPVALHGHGSRERQVRGPTGPDDPPALVVIIARRYRCIPCGAVMIVVPREVHGRRVYSASAIGFALALWGLALATAAEVRRRVSPTTILGHAAVTGWVTLRRWARDVVQRRLFFLSAPAPGPSVSLRRVAQLAAAALAASADSTTRALPIEHRAFLGAAHAA